MQVRQPTRDVRRDAMSTLVMRRPDLKALPALPEAPDGYHLRDFRSGDTAGLMALMKLAFPEAANEWNITHVRRELISNPDVKRIVVVEASGEIVATASALLEPAANPGVGVVHWVAAHPAHR